MSRIAVIIAAALVALAGAARVRAANEVNWSTSLSFSLNGVSLSAARNGQASVSATNASYRSVNISGTTNTVVAISGLVSNGFIHVSNLSPAGATNLVWCGGSVSNWPFSAGPQQSFSGRFAPDGSMSLHCACSNNTTISIGVLWTPAN